MKKIIVLGAALLVAGAGIVHAQALDPIAARQAAFALNGGTFGGIRAVVAAKGDMKVVENGAKAMAKWGAVIPTMFPKGTEKGGDTKALPEIWSDPSGFQKAAATYTEASLKLADLAKAGDADAVAAQVKVLGDSCGGCHKAYRAK